MKKMIVILLILLMSACSSTPQTEIDEGSFRYEASYNLVNNSFASEKNLIDIENDILYFPEVQEQENVFKYITYLKDDKFQIANADVNSQCDFEHLQECSSILPNAAENFNYYMGKIYYVYKEQEVNTDIIYTYLGRCDLDGSNQEELIRLEQPDIQVMTFTITFHKGYVYYSYGNNELHIISLEDMKEIKKVNFPEKSELASAYFYDDMAYLILRNYKKENEFINDVILKISLSDYEYSVFKENMIAYFIDKENIIYTKDKETWLYRITDGESIKLVDNFSTYKMANDQYYVLDNSDETIKDGGIYLFDKKGSQLDYIADNKFHFAYGIVNDKYYFLKEGNLVYYPTKDGRFQDLVTLELK